MDRPPEEPDQPEDPDVLHVGRGGVVGWEKRVGTLSAVGLIDWVRARAQGEVEQARLLWEAVGGLEKWLRNHEVRPDLTTQALGSFAAGRLVDFAQREARAYQQGSDAQVRPSVERVVDRARNQLMHELVTNYRAFPAPRRGLSRYDERAGELIDAAHWEAAALGHPVMEGPHLLLAILTREVHILAVPVEPLREEVIRRMGQRERLTSIGISKGGRRALDLAVDEADDRGHEDVRPEHVLIALLRFDRDTRALLAGAGCSVDDLLARANEALQEP